MPRTKPAYPPELRVELLKRVAAGETPEELSHRNEPSAQTIRNWVKEEANIITVSGESGRNVAELERELRQVRAGLKDAQESVEILRKAVVWLAPENRTPPRRSSS